MAAKVGTYVALVGLNYVTAKGELRVEAGDEIVDAPEKVLKALKDMGAVTEKKAAKPKAGDN
jgi:hypothetical protein